MIADRANRHAFALCWLPSGFPWDALSSTGIIAAGTQPHDERPLHDWRVEFSRRQPAEVWQLNRLLL